MYPPLSATPLPSSNTPPSCWQTCTLLGDTLLFYGGILKGPNRGKVSLYHIPKQQWTYRILFDDEANRVERYQHAAVAVTSRQVLIIGGSITKDSFGKIDLFEGKGELLEQVQWRDVKVKGEKLGERYAHSATLVDDKVYIYGGRYKYSNDILVLDPWLMHMHKLITIGELPEGTAFHSMSLACNCLVLFGGLTRESKISDEMYTLDIGTKIWTKVETECPIFKYPCSFTWQNCIYTLSGDTASSEAIFQVFDAVMKKWLPCVEVAELGRRLGQSMQAAKSGIVYVYGGVDTSGEDSNEFRFFNLSSNYETKMIKESTEMSSTK